MFQLQLDAAAIPQAGQRIAVRHAFRFFFPRAGRRQLGSKLAYAVLGFARHLVHVGFQLLGALD